MSVTNPASGPQQAGSTAMPGPRDQAAQPARDVTPVAAAGPAVDPPVAGAADHTAPVQRRGPSAVLLGGLSSYSLVFLLILSVVFYSVWSKTSTSFPTAANFQNIGGSQATLAVITLGLLITMVTGNLDLSIGSTAGLSSIATAAASANHNLPLAVAVLIGIGVGALVGLVNGLVVTRLKIDSFIVTLGTAALILGLVNWYSQGQSIIGPTSLTSFGGRNVFGIPGLIYVVLAVALVVYYLLQQTPYGRSLSAIGSNPAAARLVGIRVERATSLAFVLTGSLAGLGGVLLLARSGAGNPQVGQGFTLSAIAAAFLGAAAFSIGRLNVPGTLVAIFFLAVNITGLTFAGVAPWISDVFTGASLVIAVAFAGLLARPRKTKRAAPA